MESALHFVSTDKSLGSETIQDLKGFNSQSLSTQAMKGEQIVSMMPSIRKTFDKRGDN